MVGFRTAANFHSSRVRERHQIPALISAETAIRRVTENIRFFRPNSRTKDIHSVTLISIFTLFHTRLEKHFKGLTIRTSVSTTVHLGDLLPTALSTAIYDPPRFNDR
jgi:hypothetical protein